MKLIKGVSRIHLLFEQSGTFKNAFKSLGYEAFDYDIQNNFGETDYVIDLFCEIEKSYGGGASLFDMITENDLVIAFFPCIMFCGISQMNMTLECFRKNHGTIIGAGEYILNRSRERQRFSELLMKMCFVCIDRGIRMIFENPYSINTYLKNGFIKPPDIVDTDRTKRGDYFHKTTGYWFFNCKPMMLTTIDQTPKKDIKYILLHKHQHDTHKLHKDRVVGGSKTTGICSEGRSMISQKYARNFIADFILGEPCGTKPQQGELAL